MTNKINYTLLENLLMSETLDLNNEEDIRKVEKSIDNIEQTDNINVDEKKSNKKDKLVEFLMQIPKINNNRIIRNYLMNESIHNDQNLNTYIKMVLTEASRGGSGGGRGKGRGSGSGRGGNTGNQKGKGRGSGSGRGGNTGNQKGTDIKRQQNSKLGTDIGGQPNSQLGTDIGGQPNSQLGTDINGQQNSEFATTVTNMKNMKNMKNLADLIAKQQSSEPLANVQAKRLEQIIRKTQTYLDTNGENLTPNDIDKMTNLISNAQRMLSIHGYTNNAQKGGSQQTLDALIQSGKVTRAGNNYFLSASITDPTEKASIESMIDNVNKHVGNFMNPTFNPEWATKGYVIRDKTGKVEAVDPNAPDEVKRWAAARGDVLSQIDEFKISDTLKNGSASQKALMAVLTGDKRLSAQADKESLLQAIYNKNKDEIKRLGLNDTQKANFLIGQALKYAKLKWQGGDKVGGAFMMASQMPALAANNWGKILLAWIAWKMFGKKLLSFGKTKY